MIVVRYREHLTEFFEIRLDQQIVTCLLSHSKIGVVISLETIVKMFNLMPTSHCLRELCSSTKLAGSATTLDCLFRWDAFPVDIAAEL